MTEPKVIQLTNTNDIALVDAEDFPLLSRHRWMKSSTGYPTTFVTGTKGVLMHHLVMGKQHTHWWVWDHADRNKLNNQKNNLRLVTRTHNNTNRVKCGGGVKHSKYKGVSFDKRGRSHWYAVIGTTGKNRKCLGYFKTEEEAARAYDEAAKKMYKEYSCLNFPESI